MLIAARPLQIEETRPGLALVAHGRPAQLMSIGKPRKNSRKDGGRSVAVTLQYQDESQETLTLTIPSPYIFERLVEREAYNALQEAYEKLLASRGVQKADKELHDEFRQEFPQVFAAIENLAKANAAEREAASDVRSKGAHWINAHNGSPIELPGGLAAKNYTTWDYDPEHALHWAAAQQPGLLKFGELTEDIITTIRTNPDAYDALCTLINTVPELFTVDDSRLQKLLDGADHLTRGALDAHKLAFVKVEIASALGR